MRDGTSPKRVLVPLDGSAQARRALDPAVRIARQMDSPVELITVYDPMHGRWERDLDRVAESADYDRVDVAVVGSGWPGEVIVEMANEQRHTLVCMTALYHDHLHRLMLGSVSTHVIRRHKEALLLVGPSYDPDLAPARYERLVACLDDPGNAEPVLSTADMWARAADMAVELVHVAAPSDEAGYRAKMLQNLERLTETVTTRQIEATYALLEGPPAASIACRLAAEPEAIGFTATRARGGLARLILGSVTAELLERSRSPLFVTRAP